MILPRQTTKLAYRPAHTLVELTVALGSSAVLIAGLASVMFIGLKSADTSTDTSRAVQSAHVLNRLSLELAYAQQIVFRSNQRVDFIVTDLDHDLVPKLISYSWSGVLGDPLLRAVDSGAPSIVADHVTTFQLDYLERLANKTWTKHLSSPVATLTGHPVNSLPASSVINQTNWTGTFIDPDQFLPALPSSAKAWTIEELRLRLQKSGIADGTISVQLRRADANGLPTSEILAEESIAEADLPANMEWVSVLLSKPVVNINPSEGCCLVVSSSSNANSALIEFDQLSAGNRFDTVNAGASWRSAGSTALVFEIIGSYVQYDLVTKTQRSIAAVKCQLQQDTTPSITHSIELLNHPRPIANFWQSDFDGDPTTHDTNCDSALDWQLDGGSLTGISNGTWSCSAGQKLQINPPTPFTAELVVEGTCRPTLAAGKGAVIHIDADWQSGSYVSLTASVSLNDDGSLTAVLASDEGTGSRTLFRVEDITTPFATVRFTVDPTADLVTFAVNGIDVGTTTYVPQTQTTSTPQSYLTNDLGTAEFDHVSIYHME